MKKKIQTLLLICLSLCAMLLISGCAEKSAYEICDEEGFNVSIRFDANGGEMYSQVPSIVDTYNISKMTKNADGQVEIALLNPADTRRGQGNVSNPTYESGYYLVGWYATRTENPDGEGYIYSDLWDFDTDRVRLDPNKEYSATKPVMTLYARWEKLPEVNVYDRESNTLLGTLSFDPNLESIKMPQWKKTSVKGEIDMNDWPEKEGYTFDKAYYDLEGMKPVDTETLIHPVETDVDARSMCVYVDWLEGDWYHIFTAKQMNRSADLDGHYVICDDLDFSKADWPAKFTTGTFKGTIQTLDNAQYTFSNCRFDNPRTANNVGLFGMFGEGASISNISFETVTFSINNYNSQTAYGLFAGDISEDAQISNVSILNGQIVIGSPMSTNSEDQESDIQEYIIGLISGRTYSGQIDYSGVSYSVSSEANIVVEADGNYLHIKPTQENT